MRRRKDAHDITEEWNPVVVTSCAEGKVLMTSQRNGTLRGDIMRRWKDAHDITEEWNPAAVTSCAEGKMLMTSQRNGTLRQ